MIDINMKPVFDSLDFVVFTLPRNQIRRHIIFVILTANFIFTDNENPLLRSQPLGKLEQVFRIRLLNASCDGDV